MSPIVECNLIYAVLGERLNRCEKIRTLVQIGIGRPQNSSEPATSADPALDVEQIRFDALSACLIEAGLHNAGSFRKRSEITPLIPGTRSWPGHRWYNRDFHTGAHVLADLADKRCY